MEERGINPSRDHLMPSNENLSRKFCTTVVSSSYLCTNATVPVLCIVIGTTASSSEALYRREMSLVSSSIYAVYNPSVNE